MAYIGLSDRAILDLEDIEAHSIETWGEKVANEYLESIETALNLLRENPKLLRSNTDFSESLAFYRIRQHYLICADFEDSIFVLTIKHTAMDIPNRLDELEPQLKQEAEMLYRAYLKHQS